MKKIITTALVLAAVMANAQVTLTLDPNFGNNGLVEVNNVHPNGFLLNYFFKGDQLIVSYHGESDDDPQTNDENTKFLRINSNGTLDASYGINGSITVPVHEAYSFYAGDSYVYLNGGKKYLADGSLDTAFGNSGTLDVSPNYQYFKVLPDGKILARTENSFCRYTSSGNFDLTFGNNGCQPINPAVPVPQYAVYEGLVKGIGVQEIDPDIVQPDTEYVRKFNMNSGDLDASYGNNGYGIASDSPKYLQTLWFNQDDSSVINIVKENNDFPPTGNFFLTGTKADGHLDQTFGNAGSISIGSTVTSGGDTYFHSKVAGYGDKVFILEEDTAPLNNPYVKKMGIVCYSRSGSNQLINNSQMLAIEVPVSDMNETEPRFMEVKGNYLYLLCGKKIFRYIVGQETLSAVESLNSPAQVAFENPFKNQLTIHTKEKIKNVRVYNGNGQLVLESEDLQLNTSSLINGIYLIKITTASNRIISKKAVKN